MKIQSATTCRHNLLTSNLLTSLSSSLSANIITMNVPTNPASIDNACMNRYCTAFSAFMNLAILPIFSITTIVNTVYTANDTRNAAQFLSGAVFSLSGFSRKYNGTVSAVTRTSSIRSNHSICPIMFISTPLTATICILISKYTDGSRAYNISDPYNLKSFFVIFLILRLLFIQYAAFVFFLYFFADFFLLPYSKSGILNLKQLKTIKKGSK